MLKNHVLILTLCTTIGCASNPYKVKEVDTEVQSVHGQIQGATIAVDIKGQAIIQKKTQAEVELRTQTWKNYDLEQEINYDHDELTRCQTELADPTLGGSGKYPIRWFV